MKKTGFIPSATYADSVSGHTGKPDHYPVIERHDGLLFYIQRSQNINTVLYRLHQKNGVLDLNEPLSVNWIKYKEDGSLEIQDINFIQRELAYGYHHKVISNELIEFVFVCYNELKFYICKASETDYVVKSRFGESLIVIDSFYVFAEDLGVFPQVKFVEIFGRTDIGSKPFYHKIVFEHH